MIVCGGCSFTDADQSYYSYPVWPELLGDMLGEPVINVAKGGAGNEYIADRVIEALEGRWHDWKNETWHDTTEKVNYVFVLWSGFTRYHLKSDDNNFTKINPGPHMDRLLSGEGGPNAGGIDQLCETLSYHFTHPANPIDKSLHAFFKLQNYCKLKNIKLVGASAFPDIIRQRTTTENYTEEEIIRSFISHPLFSKIEDTFVGWPILERLGGECIVDQTKLLPPGKGAGHPSESGQVQIAEKFYENIICKS